MSQHERIEPAPNAAEKTPLQQAREAAGQIRPAYAKSNDQKQWPSDQAQFATLFFAGLQNLPENDRRAAQRIIGLTVNGMHGYRAWKQTTAESITLILMQHDTAVDYAEHIRPLLDEVAHEYGTETRDRYKITAREFAQIVYGPEQSMIAEPFLNPPSPASPAQEQ